MTAAPPPSAPSALVDRYLQEQQATQVVEASETNLFVPGAPEPGLTLPTTTYRTRRVLPRNMIPADYYAVRPADAHWSLILMLALTQLSVGAFLVERMLELFVPGALSAGIRPVHSASALAFGLLALGVSVLHLGRPQHAYRAVIGLRHSWLSHEIPAFGLFAAPDRATTPLRRDAAGVQRPASWDAALRTMVARFKAIQAQHGPESVAFLSTGQTPTEEMALLGALAKFGMGMVHGDGNTRGLLGGRDFENPAHRETVARTLGLDPEVVPGRNSWAYNRIIEGILREQIKGLWVVATNTAHSWVNQSQARDILGRLDCLVVQDMYASTETARMADLVLPAAAWGEKDGTFINSERRIGTIRKVARPPGQALPDFAIFKLVAEYWGCGGMFRAWESPAAAFQILKRLSAGQPCDITGIAGYDALEAQGGIQWPCAAGDAAPAPRSERRLFEDGRYYHPDGRARLFFESPRPLPEPTTDRFPLILLTGRGSAAQWHTQTRTSKSAVLRKLYPARAYVEVNPADAKARGIGTNDTVHVESRRGRIAVTAFVTRSVQPGHLFIPMHYEATNRLTDAVFDPYSKQPSYKACAVELHSTAAAA